MTAENADDATRFSERARGEQTVVSARADRADAVAVDQGVGEDVTRLGDRLRGDWDATHLSTRRSTEDTVRSSGHATAVTSAPVHAAGVLGSDASQIGVTATTIAYDPATEGIVLTTYEPRQSQRQAAVEPVPLPEGIADEVSEEFLRDQAEVERRYDRATNWLLVGAAALGVVVFGGAITFFVLLLQGL